MSKKDKTDLLGPKGLVAAYEAAAGGVEENLRLEDVHGPLPDAIKRIEELGQQVADLERRLDLLMRWTVGDVTGYRYPVPNFALGRHKSHPGVFPEPDYEIQGGPRKPATEP